MAPNEAEERASRLLRASKSPNMHTELTASDGEYPSLRGRSRIAVGSAMLLRS